MLGNHSPFPAWRNDDRGGCSVGGVTVGHGVPRETSSYSRSEDHQSQIASEMPVYGVVSMYDSMSCTRRRAHFEQSHLRASQHASKYLHIWAPPNLLTK